MIIWTHSFIDMHCYHICHLHICCALSLVHIVVQIAKQSQSVPCTPEEGRGPKRCAMVFYKDLGSARSNSHLMLV